MTVPTIKVKIQKRPTLKLKVLPKFPASVSADSPILIDRTGGNYEFSLDVDALTESFDPLYSPINFLQDGTGAVPYSFNDKDKQILSVKDFGVTGDGSTNDYAKIVIAVTAARAAGKSLGFPDGTYCIGSTLELGYEKFRVLALGANVTIKHTGTGVGVSFNGIGNYPASQGAAGGVFGGPNRFLLEGNANTTNLVLVDNWHFGEMKIAGKNATNAILLCQDTGIVGASAVETKFDVHITTNVSGTFTTVPLYGIRATSLAACMFDHMMVEFVGNVASSTVGVSLVSCIGNLFNGGVVESCLAGGIGLSAGCSRNTFIGIDVEVNGTQQDWLILGDHNTFIGCSGAGTTSGQFLSGSRNLFISGKYQSMSVQSGATGNAFWYPQILTAFTDAGTETSVIRPDGIATAKLAAPNVVGGTATALTGLGIRSVGSGAFDLTLRNVENLTAGRNLTLGVIDADRTVRFAGDVLFGGAASLPAIVQGDLWYGSVAGVISALAKSASASQFLKNSGTSNNPAWAQPAFTDISGSVAASQMPALTGEATTSAGAVAVTLTNSAVIAKVLTGYTSGAGTVAATDTILQAIQKLNGNDATNANLTGPITSVGNATAVASQTGTGSQFVMAAGTPVLANLSVTSVASLGADGSTVTVGPGGTGALNGRININGANAAAQGALMLFTKNLGTDSWFFGHVSAIEGSGTSSDLEYYNPGTAIRTIKLNRTNDSVAFGSGLAGTSTTAASITATSLGLTENIYAGGLASIAGKLITIRGTKAVVNGLNSDIAIPANAIVRLTGPTGAFSAGGFTGGVEGQRLTIYNTVAQTMTIVNEDASSTAGNRIKTLTGGNVVLRATATSAATFSYDATDSRWILESSN